MRNSSLLILETADWDIAYELGLSARLASTMEYQIENCFTQLPKWIGP